MPKTKLGPIVLLILSASACGSSGGDPAASSASSDEAVGRSQQTLQCIGTTQITEVVGAYVPCNQLGDFSPSLMNLCTYDNGCMAVDAHTCDIDEDSNGPGFAILTTTVTKSTPCALILLDCTSHPGCTEKPKGVCTNPQGKGFFFNDNTGYYANSIGQYCSFSTWSGWLQANGPTSGAPTCDIPASMTYAGPCTCNETCASRKATCGEVHFCGGSVSCGSCASGQVCTNNNCCSPTTCAAQNKTCGTIADGCGGSQSCGSCASGEVCTNNNCCKPTTCAAQNTTCGTIPDGCGGSLSCGGCASGQTCTSGSCVTCPNACTVGATRCGSSGVETCVAANGQCPTWTTTQVCGVRQACVVPASGAAACQCTSSCSQSSGCLDYYNLATCSVDANGCVYQTARNCYPAICASVYNSCYSYHY